MKTVCMIPARSGSKRIPNKNIKDFCGKPIITYPIEIAKKSWIFDDIVVYTNDDKLAILSANSGTRSVWRESADDYETLTETALSFLNIDGYKDIDYLCILLPTAVFINECDIYDIVDCYDTIDGCFTVCKYSHPIQRAFKLNLANQPRMIYPEYEFTRTQDLEDMYYDAGQMYFLNVKSFLEQNKIFMDDMAIWVLDAVDIDNPEDWGKAEVYYKYQRGI